MEEKLEELEKGPTEDRLWARHVRALLVYKSLHGDCLVPRSHISESLFAGSKLRLGQWVNSQRKAQRCGKLSLPRRQMLDMLDFVWRPLEKAWEDNFLQLQEYRRQTGSCRVRSGQDMGDKLMRLGRWVDRQRESRKRGALHESRIARLDALGFIWDAFDASWDEYYSALLVFQARHGHCNVPRTYIHPKGSLKLGQWVCKQRQAYRHNKMSSNRQMRLELVGFPWSTSGTSGGNTARS
eukprot:scaffold1483_cov379-Prasinococcus_capsulatus_cf.AAC.20